MRAMTFATIISIVATLLAGCGEVASVTGDVGILAGSRGPIRPVVRIVDAPDRVSNSREAWFEFETAGDVAGLRCSFNGALPKRCAPRMRLHFGNLKNDRSYELSVVAYGPGASPGRPDTTGPPANWRWRVTGVAPPKDCGAMNFTDGQFELAGGIVSTVDDCHTARAIVEEAVAGDTCQGDWDGCRVDGYECSADGAVGHLFSGCRRGDRHISWVTPVE